MWLFSYPCICKGCFCRSHLLLYIDVTMSVSILIFILGLSLLLLLLLLCIIPCLEFIRVSPRSENSNNDNSSNINKKMKNLHHLGNKQTERHSLYAVNNGVKKNARGTSKRHKLDYRICGWKGAIVNRTYKRNCVCQRLWRCLVHILFLERIDFDICCGKSVKIIIFNPPPVYRPKFVSSTCI